MEKKEKEKAGRQNQSYLGLFMVLTLVLTIPIAVLFSQQRQEIRERAAEPTQPLIAPSTSSSHTFSGYVYHDDNQDGIRQSGELPYPNVTVQLFTKNEANAEETTLQTMQTDSNGHFTFQKINQVPGLTYGVFVALPDGYKTITTNPTLFSNLMQESKDVVEFGLFPVIVPTGTTVR